MRRIGLHGLGLIGIPSMGRQPGAFQWWDPDGSIGCAVSAYQARNAGSYAASLVNLANPGTNDLTEGNGAVPWSAANGWTFTEASAQWLDTGLTPANDQSWSMLAQYANIANQLQLCGVGNGGVNDLFLLQPNRTGNAVRYGNGAIVQVAGQLLAGNLGVAGNQGYRNGAADGGAIGAWGGASSNSVYIGGFNNNGVAGFFITGDIYAIAIYSCTLTAPQVALVEDAMAAL